MKQLEGYSMYKISIAMLLVYINLFGFSNCQFKDETKDAIVTNIRKSVIDFTATLSKTIITYKEITGGYYFNSNDDRADCVLYNGGYWWKDRGGDPYIVWDFKTTRRNWGHCTPKKIITRRSYCPNGYGTPPCKKTIQYTYKQMTCNSRDVNSQGFGWELKNSATNSGTKTDPSRTTNNSSALDDTIKSHPSSINLCKRKYQECNIDCVKPLTLDTSTGKCYMSYNKSCTERGMVYNSSVKRCEKVNNCGDAKAYKSLTSSYCEALPNCEVTHGICAEVAIKTCSNSSFSYISSLNKCADKVNCSSSQYVLGDSTCGGTPFCKKADIQEFNQCINKEVVKKTCSPFNRSGNICFEGGSGNTPIVYKRPLIKVSLSGGYKQEYFGEKLNVLCSKDSNDCEFRLTDIFTKKSGKQLCFKDLQGVEGCVDIKGDCTFLGNIHYEKGIKQIRIEDASRIVAYNLMQQPQSIGSISSTCTLSGKVGDIKGIYKSSDIMSAKANGTDIEFWDSFKREFIGVISIVPTIPQKDINEGFVYNDENVMQLFSNNFTAFYTKNGATYAVYNGEISKEMCQSKIDGTSFYIPLGSVNDEDLLILSGLSLYGGENFNYQDGHNEVGTCVVKSETALSFDTSNYSIKKVFVSANNTQYVCSPFICKKGSCQYNTCGEGFSPTTFREDYFEKVIAIDYPSTPLSNICTAEKCDSNLPYFRYCGNSFGCLNAADVYQQEDGTCLRVSCENEGILNASTGKCISNSCVNSVEENGKCFKTLNLQ